VMRAYGTIVVWGLIVWLVFGAWRLRKRHVTPGAAAAAAMNELLIEDRRAAVEVIIEERTGEKDPEDRDGNLPDLERPPCFGSRVKPGRNPGIVPSWRTIGTPVTWPPGGKSSSSQPKPYG
jgi:hypothetical protein